VAERAAPILHAGHSVIVDAVYAHSDDRQAIERVAAAASVPFIGLWLDAPESTLLGRTEQRRYDPSDADAAVVRMQHGQTTGEITWHRVDASTSAASVLESAESYLREHLRDALNIGRVQP
jgi:predicted kinase